MLLKTPSAPETFSVEEEISLFAVDAYILMDKQGGPKFHLNLIF